MRKFQDGDSGVFQQRTWDDETYIEEGNFPPLKRLDLPESTRTLGNSEPSDKDLQPFPPQIAQPWRSGRHARHAQFRATKHTDLNSTAQDYGPSSPAFDNDTSYDDPYPEAGNSVDTDELPPPTDPTYGKSIDMAAFCQAVEEAGVKDFFQKVCSDIILQRPDDVFRFTAKRFRAEARLMHRNRVARQQKEMKERKKQLEELALETQQVDIRQRMEEQLSSLTLENNKEIEAKRSPSGKMAQLARKQFFVGRGGGGGPVQPLSPLAEWNRKRMAGIALSPSELKKNFLTHYHLSLAEIKELFNMCKLASVDGGRTVGTTSFVSSICNIKISYVGGEGRIDEDVAVRLFKCLSWSGKGKDQHVGSANILQSCTALAMLDTSLPFSARCECVRALAQRGCTRQYRLSRSEAQRLLWCMYVPALRVCASLHLHQSQRSVAGAGQKIRSIVWRKLSALYTADVRGMVRSVKAFVERLFKSTAVNYPQDDDGLGPVYDLKTKSKIATISFDALLEELRNGNAWSDKWARRCWTARHIQIVNNDYVIPDRNEFFDGEKLWRADVSQDDDKFSESSAWLESGSAADQKNTDFITNAISSAVEDVETEISATWVRLIFGTSSLVRAWGARPLRGSDEAEEAKKSVLQRNLTVSASNVSVHSDGTNTSMSSGESTRRKSTSDVQSDVESVTSSYYSDSSKSYSSSSESSYYTYSSDSASSSEWSRSNSSSYSSYYSDSESYYSGDDASDTDEYQLQVENEADEILDSIEQHLATKHTHSANANAYLLDVFHQADDNGDGVLEKHEMAKAFEIMGFPLTPRQIDIVMCMLDHDLSGTLAAEEFATILLNQLRFKNSAEKVGSQLRFCHGLQTTMDDMKKQSNSSQAISRAKKIFRHYDADGSGELDYDEFKGALKLMGMNIPDDKVEKLLVLLDADGGGKVNIDEFLCILGQPKKRVKKESDEKPKIPETVSSVADAGKIHNKEEMRHDGDHGLFTKSEFIAEYGGTVEWDAAEERFDRDNGLFSKAEFIEHYGGTKEWDSATRIVCWDENGDPVKDERSSVITEGKEVHVEKKVVQKKKKKKGKKKQRGSKNSEAATQIQKIFRGRSTRNKRPGDVESHAAAKQIQRLHRGSIVRKKRLGDAESHRAAVHIQRLHRGSLTRKKRLGHAKSHKAASNIQRMMRGSHIRKKRIGHAKSHHAAKDIQRVLRGTRTRKKRLGDPKAHQAAIRIQSSRRRWAAKERVRRMFEFDLKARVYDSLANIFYAVDEQAKRENRIDKKKFYRCMKGRKGKLGELLGAPDLPSIVTAIMSGPLMHMEAFKGMSTEVPGKVNLDELFRFAFCRIDPGDSKAYTQQEFADYYGAAGKEKWKNAIYICSPRSLGISE